MKFCQYLLLSSMLFSGCTQNTEKDSKSTLRLCFLSEANSLDPRYGYEIPANHLIKMLFEGLMRITPEGELKPGSAQSYTVSKDQKTYTFHLRPSIYWSNGEPVTAYDFEYAWKSIIDPKLPTQGASDFYPIKNVEGAIRGDLALDDVGVKALDNKTLNVELEYPTPYFLELTATSAFAPVCSTCKEERMDAIYNGPFLIQERLPHHKMVLVKNPHFWDASSVHLEKIEISIVHDVATQLALFEKGKIDWFGKPFAKLPLDAVPTLMEKGELSHFPEKAVYWYFLNTEKFPFTDQKFREAFGLAINRQEIVDHVLKEGEQIATSVNRGHHFFKDHDLLRAKQLFQEALEEHGLTQDSFPEMVLSYCGIETNHRIAAAVQQQWQKDLGVTVRLDPQEWTCYYDNLTSGNYLIGGMSWHSRIRDPIYNLQLFKHAQDRQNISLWENEQYQNLIDLLLNTTNQAEREHLLTEAEALLMKEMPVIPIYFLTVSYAKNQDLKGVYISEINEIDFAWAQKE